MSPQISIEYNSSGGNGPLGYGWHLSGISSITRSSKIPFYDGAYDAVNLDSYDRFELNGDRLMLYSGLYGSANSEYRMETNSSSRIKAYGALGNGPLYFTEETKSGLTIEYGNTSDSRIDFVGNNSTAYGWLINKVTDKSGNYIKYNYLNSQGQYLIRSIAYTGNTIGMSPYDSVVFNYAERTKDIVTSYVANESYTLKKLLKDISVYSEGTLIRKYELSYSGLFYSQLVELDEFNKMGEKCNPTIIKYGSKGEFVYGNTQIPTQYNEFVIGMSDYNLDGKDDFVTWAELPGGATRWACYLATSDGKYALKNSKTYNLVNGQVYREIVHEPYTYNFSANNEYTGDGIPDVLMQSGDSLLCFPYGDSGLALYPVDICSVEDLSDHYPGDFNGDGIDEELLIGPGTAKIHSFSQYKSWDINLPGSDFFLADVNGDSKREFILLTPTGYSVYKFNYSSGTDSYNFIQLYSGTSASLKLSFKDHLLEGDFNGDGKSDLLVKGDTGWYILNSTGSTFVLNSSMLPISPSFDPFITDPDKSIYVRDLNNDSKSDIVTAQTIKYFQNTTEIDSVRIDFYLFNGKDFLRYKNEFRSSIKPVPGS